ncbi:site-specific integrase [Cytobacillus depressus]|uniref:Site-specific integrase n=1 Tax=Cytobacillus depressus TaxID=1602942 RepID=A0A6L3V3I0_9BACI|nr:site-specific integrase [Cytobacillus depressus]KAB2328988.1 site-specific integrase [Cytobacillus depressus]
MKTVQPIRNHAKIQEIGNVLMHNSYRDYFLFIFGINSGLRISDILPLKVKDVKNKNFLIARESKTGKERRIPMLPVLKEEIEKYIAGMKLEDYLFKSVRTRKPITRIQAYRILRSAAEKVGLEEIGSHSLRKTFGYHFYQQTKDVAMLQEIFNHSSPSITLRYIGINDDMINEAFIKFGGLR